MATNEIASFCIAHRSRQLAFFRAKAGQKAGFRVRLKYFETKKWHTRRSRVCHWCFYTTFWRLLWYITESDARQHGIRLFYMITKSLFYFKIFEHNVKAGLLPRLCTKKAIWHDLWSIQNEAISLVAIRSKELWLVEKNRATVKPDSSVAPPWMKTYSESIIELRNLQILKKILEKSSQFLSSEEPCEPKILDVALKITGVEKNTFGKLVVTVNLEAIWFEFWMKGA